MSKKLLFIVPLLLLVFCFCSKENEEDMIPEDLIYQSLEAEKDTIVTGEEIKVKATASGTNLSYIWVASLGDILGSGKEVIYVSSPCQVGTNQITCEITNGKKSESKTIDIVVIE